MTLHPPDAEARLGFDGIRARLAAHARTPYGAERLAALAPSAEPAAVRLRLARAGQMADLVRASAAPPVRELDDVRPALARLRPKGSRVDGADLAALGRALAALREVHDALHRTKTQAPDVWTVATGIVVLKALEDRIGRTVDDAGAVRDDASPLLAQLARQISERQAALRAVLAAAFREALAAGWAAPDAQPTLRGGRAVIPVRADAKRKVRGVVHDVSATGQTVYVEPAAVLDAGNDVRELEIARGREVERVLAEVSAHVRHHRAEIAAGLDALGELDALLAAGRLAAELDALVPEVDAGGPLRLVRARHPGLVLHLAAENAAAAREGRPARAVVPLTLSLGDTGDGAAVTLVLTGPNAGGKSVAMKSVGLLTLLAACGLPVPAAPGTRIPLPTQLFVDVGDQQSVADDLSTFTSHLANVARMLERADERSLCLIDEAGTGTDPAEGGALAEAVLRRLTARGAHTVVTSHLGALKAFAHETPGVANGSMAFDADALAPTYRFRPGVPGSSYAFEIADRVGLDRPVVDEARRLAGAGTVRLDALIAEAERRTADAEAAQAEAEALRSEAARVRADYEARLERLRADTDARRAAALAEADEILRGANAAVERAVREIREAQAETDAVRAARERVEAARETVQKRQGGVARRERERRRRAPEPASAPAASGPIGVGDRVRVEGADAVGEVLEIGPREAVVALGGLTSRVKLGRLTKVGGRVAQRVEVRLPQTEAEAAPVLRARTRVDLRGARVEDAVPEVERFVDDALVAGVRSVEILHGKGTGALRAAIHEALARRGDVAAVEAAPWNQGGDGVTVVRLEG